MRRKVAAGRRPVEDFTMTAEKALGHALTRAAQDLMALPLRVTRLHESRLTLSDLPELLEDRALLALLAGPDDAMGLIAIGPAMLSALIEMRMLGRVSPQPAAPRRPTRTDAALVADFLDASLAALDEALVTSPARVWAVGFRYAAFVDDPRPLPLMLEDAAYRGFRFEMDLGLPGQARSGTCLLVLPAEGRGQAAPPPPMRPIAVGEDAVARATWARLLEAAVLEAPGVIEGVLARIQLPLGMVLGLAPGQMVDLPAGVLDAARVEGPGGRLLCEAQLGRQQGLRALRLVPHPGPGKAPSAPAPWGNLAPFAATGGAGVAMAPRGQAPDPSPSAGPGSG